MAYFTCSYVYMQYTNLTWRNGHPYSDMFDDIYYSSDETEGISGESEFNHVFFESNGLPGRWQDSDKFVIAELGLGSTLNCLLTIRQWLKYLDENKGNKCLHYIALEKYPLSPDVIVKLISKYPDLKDFCDELIRVYPPAVKGSHVRYLFNNKIVIHYKFMDAYEALENEQYNVDAWFLDGFSPAKNPEMWSEKLFAKVAQNSHCKTSCSTYTSAGYVRRNLQQVGFDVCKVAGYGRKRTMLVATFNAHKKVNYTYLDKPWYARPQKMPDAKVKKATVLGAGIAGLSVAYSLIKRGWQVTIIDRHSNVAKEASSNPAAIIYPRLSVNNDVDSDFYCAAYCHTLYTLGVLQSKYKEKFWYNDGLLQYQDKSKFLEINKKFSFNNDFLASVSSVEKLNLSVEESEKVLVHYPSAGVVLPDVLCKILVEECGDQLNFVRSDIDEVRSVDDKWQCCHDESIIDEQVVLIIANGNGVNGCNLGFEWSIESIRGQVAILNENDKSKNLKKVINHDVYVSPSINQKHYLGATYSRDSLSLSVSTSDNETLIKTFDKLCPGMFNLNSISTSWVGVRAMSKDRAAIVGAIPNQQFFRSEYSDLRHGRNNKAYLPAEHTKGLYVSLAHGSRGFTSSFLSAEIIAAQIEGEPMPVNKLVTNYLNPSRFVVNNLKRG